MRSHVAVGVAFALLCGTSASAGLRFSMADDVGVHHLYRTTLGNGRHRIYAEGDIEVADANRLRAFVEKQGVESAVVVFNSRGGSLLGGIVLGEAIRKLELDTAVAARSSDFMSEAAGVCASACAYAFAGGRSRYLRDDSRLGLHQFYGEGDNTGDRGETQAVSGLLVDYLARMGVDSSAFVIASSAPGDKMVWLSKDEAKALRLVNDGALPTKAEIKLTDGMIPYLRLEQDQDSGTARVLMLCEAGTVHVSGGIVTTPELTQSRASGAQRSYFEVDNREALALPAPTGLIPRDSTLWIDRKLNAATAASVSGARTLGLWTENGSAFRWGLEIDLVPVKEQVAKFVQNCLSSGS